MTYEKVVKPKKLTNEHFSYLTYKSFLDFTCEKYIQFHMKFLFVTSVRFDHGI